MADRGLVGIRQPQHDVAGGGQHAGRAVAALQRVVLVERGAQVAHHGVVVVAFDGHHLAARAGAGKGDAGAHGLVVDQHGAGPANPVLAAQVGAGQALCVAQEVAQVGAVRAGAGSGAAIDRQCDGFHCGPQLKSCWMQRVAAAQ